jgi:hypothetical protein
VESGTAYTQTATPVETTTTTTNQWRTPSYSRKRPIQDNQIEDDEQQDKTNNDRYNNNDLFPSIASSPMSRWTPKRYRLVKSPSQDLSSKVQFSEEKRNGSEDLSYKPVSEDSLTHSVAHVEAQVDSSNEDVAKLLCSPLRQ